MNKNRKNVKHNEKYVFNHILSFCCIDLISIYLKLRDLITRNEELESANNHLQKRVDKLKSNRILIQANGNVNSLPSTPTNHNNVPTSGPIFPNSSNSSTTNNTSSSSMSSTNDDSSNSTEYSSECSSMIAIE